MARALKRIRLEPETDILRILEDVHSDRIPRLIEHDGVALAVVVDPEAYAGIETKPRSRRFKRELLSLAGAWSDLDADRMIEELFKARHDAPPSPPVEA